MEKERTKLRYQEAGREREGLEWEVDDEKRRRKKKSSITKEHVLYLARVFFFSERKKGARVEGMGVGKSSPAGEGRG